MFASAAAVHRGDALFPRIIEDDFARSLVEGLGRTPVGNVPWKVMSGKWTAADPQAHVPLTAVNPVALVNARFPDADINADVSDRSGDAIILRASRDGSSYLRVGSFYDTDEVIQTAEEYRWTAGYGNPGSSTYTEYEWRAEFGGYAIPGWHSHPDPGDPVAEQSGPIVKTMWSSSNSSCPIPTNYPGHPSWRPGAPHSHLIYGDDFTEPNVMNTHKHTQTSCATTGATRQRTYSPPAHTHSRSEWSSSSTTSPLPSSLTHSHGIGTHTHSRSSTSLAESRTVVTSRTFTPVRSIHLEQVENGVVTTLGSWSTSEAATRIRVLADGSTIQIWMNNGVFVAEVTLLTFNQAQTFHGLGRRGGGIQGTNLTNFRIRRL